MTTSRAGETDRRPLLGMSAAEFDLKLLPANLVEAETPEKKARRVRWLGYF